MKESSELLFELSNKRNNLTFVDGYVDSNETTA